MPCLSGALALVLAAAEALSSSSLTAPPLLTFPAGGGRHLFADDALIDSFSGGVRVRQGSYESVSERPVLLPDAPWEAGCMVYWLNSFLRNPTNHTELRCSTTTCSARSTAGKSASLESG